MRHVSFRLMGGFKALDLMIVFAVVTVSINLGWPSLSNFAIRSKAAEALSVADTAKRDIIIKCSDATPGTALTNKSAGYAAGAAEYVREVTLSGTCANPVITLFTENTGASIDPVLMVVGTSGAGRGQGSWVWSCQGDGLAAHLPDACRR
jgi:Tfp pilus assembly protein PilE